MRKTSAIAVVAGLLLAGGAAQADGYGAMAYSEPHDNLNIVKDHDTRAEAERRALEGCEELTGGDGTCAVVLWFFNACGGFAKAEDGAWGTGWGDTIELAERWAVATCAEHTDQTCEPTAVVCTNGHGGYLK